MWILGVAFAGEEVCSLYGTNDAPVEVDTSAIPDFEASGLAAARTEDEVYYTHDDNKGQAELYLVRGDGSFLVSQTIDGASNEDWEDIAPGPCPASIDAEHCLWIGDIGDNDKVRATIDVWVVPESTAASATSVRCSLVYPDGRKRDAEALFVAPDGTLRIVTKDNDGAKVFLLAEPACDGGGPQTLMEEAELALEEPVTGAAMNPEGTAVVLRGLTKAWMWTGCRVEWNEAPVDVDLGVQPQGEALTFANDGSLVSTSEIVDDEPFRLWRTPCEETSPVPCATCGDGTGGGCGSGSALLVLLPLGLFTAARGRRGARPRSGCSHSGSAPR